MKTLQMALTGALHHQNKGASDWGWPGLLAYGCQNFVVVVDTRTVQVIQTLDRHKTNVVKVKWARENYHHDLNLPYTLRLASADSHGRIVVWDVSQGLIRADFYDGTKPVQDLEWLSTQDACPTLLAAIHPPSSVVLWNADTGTKLWKKNFNETLLSFAFDPFNPANMTLLANDCILFVSDFMTSRPPSGTGRRFYISNPSSPVHSGAAEGGRSSERRTGGRSALRRNFKLLVGDVKDSTNKELLDSVFPTSKGGEDTVTLNECLQLMYLRSCRNHLLLVYSKELLILDLEIKQTVGIVAIERSGSPFLQVIACRQRDALLCLHENGSVTVRVRRKVVMGPFSTPVDQIGNMASQQTGDLSPLGEQDVTYELRCQSEALRITKHIRISGMAACPVNERSVAVFVNDGRIMFWNLTTIPAVVQARDTPNHTQTHLSPLHSPGFSLSDSGSDPYKYPSSSSSSEASTAAASPAKTAKTCSVPRMCNVPHTKMAICDMIGQTYGPTEPSVDRQGYVFRFTLQGLLSGLPLPPTIIKMCPPLTTKNWNVYRPLLAVGSSHGLVQVYNLSSGLLWREFNIHTCQVRGLEWTSLTSFLSFAYPSPGQSGLVKNELLLVNLQTGSSELFRGDKGNDESPIEIVRISHLKQYAIIVFKDKPMELWDIRSQTLLREMPKNFPTISALEWSPSNNLKSLKKKLSQDPTSAAASPTVELLPTIGTETKTQTDSKKLANLTVREHFVFTDSDGQLYHFMVEGNIVKDGSKIPPDGTMGAITCIAWKGDTMVLGDVDGNINIWDLKAKISRAVPTHRGWIKKLKFAPGRGNQKILVLYNDGAEVWDAKEVEMVSSVKCPRDMAKVIDIDWASSDKPVLACDDGTVRVSDMDMKNACAPVTERDITEPVFSPHLVPPAAAFTVKYLLQHQPWNTDFSYSLTDLHGKNGEELQRIVNEQLQLIPSDLQEYLPVCPYGTAQRCLIVSRLFGDESELHFWTAALHNLRREQARLAAGIDKDLLPSTPTSDMFLPVDSASSSQGDLLASENTVGSSGDTTSSGYFPLDALSLDTCYDILCDQPFFQKYQLERINLHDSKRATYEHTQHCAEKLLMLGQSDRAVQLYLETDADNDNYFSDSLRACLIATIRSSGASQSTIKLVATNLIANGKLPEGVQLLCLIDKAFDACRYLQDYGEWDQAAWLAKASLNNVECSEVMKRWVDHLCSSAVNYKSKAILVLLSLGHFLKVLELLYSMRHFDRAALFAEACLEFGVLILNEETSSLIEAIFLEYARYLHNLGNLTAMEHYCHKAGGKGQQLLRDVQMENAQLQEKTAGEGSGDGGADQEGDADTSEGAEEGLL